MDYEVWSNTGKVIIELTTIYFAHPWIKRKQTELLIDKMKKIGYEVFEPFSYEIVLTRKWFSGNGSFNICKEIVNKDINLIKKSDIVVASVPTYKTIGTIAEIFYAGYIKKKPVYILSNLGYYKKKHPWLYYAKIFNKEEDLLKELEIINGKEIKK